MLRIIAANMYEDAWVACRDEQLEGEVGVVYSDEEEVEDEDEEEL